MVAFLQAGVGIVIMFLLTQINRMNLLEQILLKVSVIYIFNCCFINFCFRRKDSLDGMVWMVLGSVVGAWLSSRWSVKKGDKVIRVTLLIMVSYMAVKLWFDTFNT